MSEKPEATSRIEIAVSAGELVDKVTILEIKAERIPDASRQANIRRELAALAAKLASYLASEPGLSKLKSDLRALNATLWQVEDDIRDCERRKDFGPRFVELARAVYRTNDRRAALKREIDQLLGSQIIEEKSYEPYD
jgi:hypothetical protein